MKISLVLATLGRSTEVARVLESIAEQCYRPLQLIVVDQNADDRVQRLLTQLPSHLDVVKLASPPGLSRARNVGLAHATGEIVGFPDDDCWYPPDLLQRIARWFRDHPRADGVTGTSFDPAGSVDRFGRAVCSPVTLGDVWQKGVSYTIFVRAWVCREVGAFDEKLGVGAGTPYGSAEETDYLIRALKHGASLLHQPDLVVFHPDKAQRVDEAARARAYDYGVGMGYVLRKHDYPVGRRLLAVARPLGGAAVAALSGNLPLTLLHWRRAVGRWDGLLSKAHW